MKIWKLTSWFSCIQCKLQTRHREGNPNFQNLDSPNFQNKNGCVLFLRLLPFPGLLSAGVEDSFHGRREGSGQMDGTGASPRPEVPEPVATSCAILCSQQVLLSETDSVASQCRAAPSAQRLPICNGSLESRPSLGKGRRRPCWALLGPQLLFRGPLDEHTRAPQSAVEQLNCYGPFPWLSMQTHISYTCNDWGSRCVVKMCPGPRPLWTLR